MELPQNLSNKENVELFKQNGDLKLRNKIIEGNLRLVPYIVNKFIDKLEFCCIDYEDLYSLGYIGLVRSVDSFDVSK